MKSNDRKMLFKFAKLFFICSVLSACTNYPQKFSADEGNKSAKVILESPKVLDAFLGASMKKEEVEPPFPYTSKSLVRMAPAASEENGIIRFGAFTIRHGKDLQFVTAYWWNQNGELKKHSLGSENDPEANVIWINERIFTVNWGGKRIQTFRLNDTAGNEFDELN